MLKTISLSEKFTFINKTIFKTVAQLSQYSLTHYMIKQNEYGFYGENLGDSNGKFNEKFKKWSSVLKISTF